MNWAKSMAVSMLFVVSVAVASSIDLSAVPGPSSSLTIRSLDSDCVLANGTTESVIALSGGSGSIRGIAFNSATCGNIAAPYLLHNSGSGTLTLASAFDLTLSGGAGNNINISNTLNQTTGRLISRNATGGISVGTSGSAIIDIAAGGSTITLNGVTAWSNSAQIVTTGATQSVASDGAGTAAAFNVNSAFPLNEITCNDADGCNATMLEASIADGQQTCFVNVSANVVNIADTAGLSETAGAFAMGQYDSICFKYIVDRWVEVSRSNN